MLAQVASALDGVDGEIARVSGRSSAQAAVLDAVCDRYGDLAVLAGAAVAAGAGAWPWAIAALAANWQLSFLRREHERIAGSLPASHVRWQWSRGVRILALAVSCILLHPLWGLIAWAVLGNADALRRLIALLRLAHGNGRPSTSRQRRHTRVSTSRTHHSRTPARGPASASGLALSRAPIG